MIHTVCYYVFSPTGGTKKAGEIFCRSIAENVKTVDLGGHDQKVENPKADLAVIAVPVFGGRVPNIVTERLKKLDGKRIKMVTLAVYGNRAYEDALLELNQTAKEQGFQVIASAALIAQHSIVPEVGEGRPDADDQKEIKEFAQKVLNKIQADQEQEGEIEVPGNYPYKDAMNTPAAPISLPSCNQCGKCAEACPTKAISIKDEAVTTETEKCILCMACTAACPKHARILPPPVQKMMEQKLSALKTVRKENEFFL
mgnify:CR=1 FL=1